MDVLKEVEDELPSFGILCISDSLGEESVNLFLVV
jgi:hypothetical protein